MTNAEYLAELARLEARRRVTPATPEYLAEIDAKIDRLKAEFAATPFTGDEGLQAIIANGPALAASLGVKFVALNKLRSTTKALNLSYAIEDMRYGFSTIPKLPDDPGPPPGYRQD